MSFIRELEDLLLSRKKSLPAGSYSSELFRQGLDHILQKFGEESVEYLIASKNSARDRQISEGADVLFHFLVSLIENNISYEDIVNELEKRHQKS